MRRAMSASARGWVLGWAAMVAGCATPPAVPPRAEGQEWSGKLVVKVDGDPPQRFSAMFELSGSAEAGALVLSTPLGTRLAETSWAVGQAQMRVGGTLQRFDSVEAMTETLAGTRLPVGALFGWLAGRHTDAEGWQADLSGNAKRQLVARRLSPKPEAEIRIVWDAPAGAQP